MLLCPCLVAAAVAIVYAAAVFIVVGFPVGALAVGALVPTAAVVRVIAAILDDMMQFVKEPGFISQVFDYFDHEAWFGTLAEDDELATMAGLGAVRFLAGVVLSKCLKKAWSSNAKQRYSTSCRMKPSSIFRHARFLVFILLFTSTYVSSDDGVIEVAAGASASVADVVTGVVFGAATSTKKRKRSTSNRGKRSASDISGKWVIRT